MKIDIDIKKRTDLLSAKLAKYLVKKGKKYVNDNYYLTETFTNTLLNYNLHTFLKDKSETNLDSAIREYAYNANLPNSLRQVLSYFIKNDFDIVGAFERYVKQPNEPTGQFDKVLLSDQENKVELTREYNSKYENEYLTIRLYKNTSISGIDKFLSKHGNVIRKWLPTLKQTYPHSKGGKIDYFQKLKQVIADYEKNKAKITNKALDKNQDTFRADKDIKPDKDTEIAGLVLGGAFYETENAKKGARILRYRRNRLHKKLQK